MRMKTLILKFRENDLFWLAALLLTFTFFVFGPCELYMSNSQSLWFEIFDIIPVISVAALAFIAVLFAVYRFFPNKARRFFCFAIWGLGMAFYLQGNYLQLRYGLLDGSEVDWSGYFLWGGLVNTAVWCVCIVASILMACIKKPITGRILRVTACLIIVVQIVTICVLDFNLRADDDAEDYAVTTKGMLSVSGNENIVIFLLDTFDAGIMDELIETDPEFFRAFEGFTYYNNTVGMYPTTKGALPHILTGIPYKNEVPYRRYVNRAFERTGLYGLLDRSNYKMGLYTLEFFLGRNATDIAENVEETVFNVEDKLDFAMTLYRFVATRYFPHVLKRFVWMYSGEFDRYKKAQGASAPVYAMDDVDFNAKLVSEGIRVDWGGGNDFRFFHMMGAHKPYTYDDRIRALEDGETGDMYGQPKGALRIVLNYIQELKQKKVYDNTLMIVMADHGSFEHSQAPLLMIKDRNGGSAFAISPVPVSYENMVPMLESWLADNIQPNEFLKSVSKEIRPYYYYAWDGNWGKDYLPRIVEYEFRNGKNDMTQEYPTGNVFEGEGDLLPYALGTVLRFDSKSNGGARYFIFGLSATEATHTWSSGKVALFRAQLETKPPKNLLLSIDADILPPLDGYQVIKLYANDAFIDEKKIYPSDTNVSFIIPKTVIGDDNELSLWFEYPNAATPLSLGINPDGRILAISFREMRISEVD